MKAINKEAKEILERILGNIIPIKSLNTRVVRIKYSDKYIRIKKRSLNNHGHIITISTIVQNKKGRYFEIPKIDLLRPLKDMEFYPIECINTKTKWSVIVAETSKNSPNEYRCTDLLLQEILTDYVDLYLEILDNAKILD